MNLRRLQTAPPPPQPSASSNSQSTYVPQIAPISINSSAVQIPVNVSTSIQASPPQSPITPVPLADTQVVAAPSFITPVPAAPTTSTAITNSTSISQIPPLQSSISDPKNISSATPIVPQNAPGTKSSGGQLHCDLVGQYPDAEYKCTKT